MTYGNTALSTRTLVVGLKGLTVAGSDANATHLKAVAKFSLTNVAKWPSVAGDDLGMGNTQGIGTGSRYAFHMAQAGMQSYELAHMHRVSIAIGARDQAPR